MQFLVAASCFPWHLFLITILFFGFWFVFFPQSCLAISGCQWRAWWFSCSCATCFTRSKEEFGGTRTTCAWLETWKLGEPLICSGILMWILMGGSWWRNWDSLMFLWYTIAWCKLEKCNLANLSLKSLHLGYAFTHCWLLWKPFLIVTDV